MLKIVDNLLGKIRARDPLRAALDGQPELYENYLYWWRLDDVKTKVWFQGAFESPSHLQVQVKCTNAAVSGTAAVKVVVNGISQGEQLLTIPAGGALSAWQKLKIVDADGMCALALEIDTASENHTTGNESILIIDACEVS